MNQAKVASKQIALFAGMQHIGFIYNYIINQSGKLRKHFEDMFVPVRLPDCQIAVASEESETVLFSVTGSQFVAKVATALDAIKVPYKVVELDITKLKEQLPTPHTVPQLQWRGELLTDSAQILRRLDQDIADAPFKLYPADKKEKVEELEDYVGNTLNAYVWYFTFWDEHGFKASFERKMGERFWPLPGPLGVWVAGFMIDTGRLRGSMRKRARGILGEDMIPQGRATPEEEAKMRQGLVEQILKLDETFADASQQWLCGTAHPSAADFSLYGVIERLVGSSGDGDMGTATPWLWDEAKSAGKLQAWHARMCAAYPIQFKGKTAECKVWVSA